MTKIIKCAVIGTGYLGKFHAEKYTKLPNARLIAICDTDPIRTQTIAKNHGIATYTDYRELLGQVDAVSITTTTTTHYAIAKAFLQSKTHVLLEKPITTTIAEAQELIALAQKNQVILQSGHLERFNAAFTALNKEIVQPSIMTAVRLAPYKPRGNDVSVVLDLMIHDIDLVCHLAQSEITNIQAKTATVISPTSDFALATLEFASGCIAHLTASRISPNTQRTLTVIQNNVGLHADLQNTTLIINRQDPTVSTSMTKATTMTLTKGDALLDEITSFINAIVQHQSPAVSGVDGMRALHIAQQINEN